MVILYFVINKKNQALYDTYDEQFSVTSLYNKARDAAKFENIKKHIPMMDNVENIAKIINKTTNSNNSIKKLIPDVVKQTAIILSEESPRNQTIVQESKTYKITPEEKIELNKQISNLTEIPNAIELNVNNTLKILNSTIAEENIEYPDEDNLVEYSEECSQEESNYVGEVGANDQREIKTCANDSIRKQKQDCYGNMINNSGNINDIKFPICNNSNNEPVELNDDYDIDYLEYYRKHQMFVKSYLEDPVMRGYNVMEYNNVSPLFLNGKIPLDKKMKFPKPSGYTFDDAPTYIK